MVYCLCRYPRVYLNREINVGLQAVRCLSNVRVHGQIQEVLLPAPTQVTHENQHDSLARVVTPLWRIPYQEQLAVKLKWSRNAIHHFTQNLRRLARNKKLSFRIHPVEPSPVTEGYRNKDEFSIQRGVDGNPKTVGFFVGSPAEGAVVCVRATHLINMRGSHKLVAEAYEEYIRTSPLPACLHFADGGHWRNLTVRSNEAGQLMAAIAFHPQDMESQQVQEEADRLQDFFLHGPGARCNLSSLYFQPCRHTRCTAEQAPYRLLLGAEHLTQRLAGCRFRISPDSFFQVNTAAAEVLYRTVLQLALVTPTSTLLDVCCGTGTVSILASRLVRGAVGVEAVHSAVEDARHNALLNAVHNVEFVPGLAEKEIPRLVSDLGLASSIVAVVNPGRSGLHARAVRALCGCEQVRSVVYVACKADSPNTVANFVQLCSEGGFCLRDVVPVDLFPHTLHTELVMAFRR